MKYYSKEFRVYLIGLLTGYRKMIEQSLASNTDSNYHLLANDVKKQIDEALKILPPTVFNSTDKTFLKMQEDTEEHLRKMEEDYREKEEKLEESYREKEETLEKSYRKKEEELKESYQSKEKNLQNAIDEKIKAEKQQQEEKIRSELAEKFEQEKKTMISVELLPELLQQFFAEKGIVNTVQAGQAPVQQTTVPQAEQAPDEKEDDSFGSNIGYDDTSDRTE